MKSQFKLATMSILLTLMPFLSQAQKGTVLAGAHGGVNVSKLCCGSMTINENYKFGEGPAFGLTASYGVSKYISVAAELNYTTMGGKKNGMQAIPGSGNGSLYADFDNKVVLNYLELPVMARITMGDKIKYYANVGIFGGYLLSASQKASGSSKLYSDKEGSQVYSESAVDFNTDTDISAQVKDWNFGIVGGLGAGYTFGKHGIWLDGRYCLGMPNIWENTTINGENSTGSIMATIGYTYTLK